MKFLRKLLVTLLLFNSISVFATEDYLQSIDSELHRQLEKKEKGTPSDKEHLNEYSVQINKILKGWIPLYDKEGKKDKAKSFLNSLDNHGKTPLMYAIQFNDTDSVDYYLELGADPNIKSDEDKTALLIAIETAKEIANKNQNEKTKIKRIISSLLNKNADADYIYISNKEKYSPLLLACTIEPGRDYEFKREIIKKILSKTTKYDEIGNFENGNLCLTPLSYLCYSNEAQEYKDLIKELVKKNSDINKKITISNFNGTIFQYLCAEYKNESYSIIKILIENTDVDSSFYYKEQTLTPLICSVCSNDKAFIELICGKITNKDNARKSYTINYEGREWTGSALHLVARQGNKILYKDLKDKGYNNTEKDSLGKTAIDYLKESCKTKVDELFLVYELAKDDRKNIEAAIDAIVDVQKDRTSDGNQQTAIHVILSNNDEESAIKLLKLFKEKDKLSALVQEEDSNGRNAIDYAILNKNQKVIKWFIDEHVVVGKSIFTVIDKYLAENDRTLIGILESFLRMESNPNILEKRFSYNSKGFVEVNPIVYTAMIVNDASKNVQQIQIIEKLLENNININACAKYSSEEGNSALIYAIKNNNSELAEYLISKGINLELASKPTIESAGYGKTAIFYALEKENDEIVRLILKQNELKQKDIKLQDTGETLLMFFAKYSTPELLKALLPYYVQINKNCMEEKDKSGMTPFLWAVKENETMEIAKLLRIYGADVSARNNLKENAIKIAKDGNGNIDEKIKRLESWGVENDR